MKAFGGGLRRFCSLVVSLALVSQFLIPATALAVVKPKPVPREMVERRGVRSKTIDNGDGTYPYQSFLQPIHYMDPSTGIYQPIDTALAPIDPATEPTASPTAKSGWKNKANAFVAKLPKQLGSDWVSIETTRARVAY